MSVMGLGPEPFGPTTQAEPPTDAPRERLGRSMDRPVD